MYCKSPTPTKHDFIYIKMLQSLKELSKDPSTKTAAAIVRPDKSIASLGYNGFPRKIYDYKELLDDRMEKYLRIVHCEMNALMFCRDHTPLEDYTLVTLGPSCADCAKHMIQAGITRFVFTKPTKEQYKRWKCSVTFDMFKEAKVIVVQV